jgi:hypothetical protein
MINQGWTWADLQTLTFRQLNLFSQKMNERIEKEIKAMKR